MIMIMVGFGCMYISCCWCVGRSIDGIGMMNRAIRYKPCPRPPRIPTNTTHLLARPEAVRLEDGGLWEVDVLRGVAQVGGQAAEGLAGEEHVLSCVVIVVSWEWAGSVYRACLVCVSVCVLVRVHV